MFRGDKNEFTVLSEAIYIFYWRTTITAHNYFMIGSMISKRKSLPAASKLFIIFE